MESETIEKPLFTFDPVETERSKLESGFLQERYDYDIRMYKDGKSLVVQAPTWRMRNNQTIDNYIDEFIKNPSNATRDFGANPIDAVSPAIEHRSFIDKAFEKLEKTKHPIKRNPYVQPSGEIIETLFATDFTCNNKAINRYAHIDIGLTRDRLGLAIGHAESWQETNQKNVSGQIRKVKEPVITFDLLASFKGYKDNPIQLIAIRQVIFDMVKLGFNIDLVTLDGYQSADFMQALNIVGIKSKTLSIDRSSEPFDELIKSIYGTRINLYPLIIKNNTEKIKENLPHKELRQLEKFGDKYDHPVGGSHDLIQAIAGVVVNIKQYAKSGTGGFVGYLS